MSSSPPGPDQVSVDVASYSELLPPLPEVVQLGIQAGDLQGQDLRQLVFRGQDLSGLHLEKARLDGSDLRDCSLVGANLSHASLVGARFSGADFTGADLSGADCRDAVLDGATFERTVLHGTSMPGTHVRDSRWAEVEAEGCDWTGIDLTGATFHRVDLKDIEGKGALLEGCTIRDSDWARLHLHDARAARITIVDSTLEDVDLPGADLSGATARFANWDRVLLEGADLRGASLDSVAFRGCSVAAVKAEGATLARCAGLDSAALDALRAGGATVMLPLHRRLWRGLGQRRFGRLIFVLLCLAVIGGVSWWLRAPTPEEVAREEEPDDNDLAILAGVDAATAERWEALQDRYSAEPSTRPASLIGLAAILEQTGRFDDAEEHLREAIGLLQLHPEQRSGSPELALGSFMVRQERLDEAFDIARSVISGAATPADRVAGYVLMAEVRLAQDDPAGALAELSTVTTSFGNDAGLPRELRVRAAALLEAVGEDSAALALLEGAPLVGDESDAKLLLAQAALHGRSGNPTEALARYDRVIRDFGGNPLLLDRALQAREDTLKSVPDLESEAARLEELAQAEDPRLALEGELGLARLAVRRDDRDAALRRYRRVLEQFDDAESVRAATRELAQLHQAGGEIDEAVTLLRRAVKAAPSDDDRVVLREDLARLLQDAGRYNEAKEVLARTLRDFPDDVEFVARARLHLAGISDQAGEVDAALVLYEQVAGADTEVDLRAAALFGQATLLRRIGRAEDALPVMDRVMEMLPERHLMRGKVAVERAELLSDLGRASVSDLGAMLAEARDSGVDREAPAPYAELLLLLATALETEGRDADALALFQRIAASPAGVEIADVARAALEGQVRTLVALDRADQADALLGQDPTRALGNGEAVASCDAQATLARSRAEAGDLPGAADAFDVLLASCRGPRFLVAELPVITDILTEGGLDDRAHKLLHAVRAEASSDVGRQAAHLELGRLGDAESLDAAMAGPDRALAALARISRGDQLAEAGRLAEAEPLWTHVVDDPAAEPVPRSLALLGLARLEMARGKPTAARGHLEEVRLVAAEPWLVQEATAKLDALKGQRRLDPESEETPTPGM